MGKSLLIPTLFGRAAALLPMGRLGQAYFERYGARADRCYWVPYEPPYHLFETVEQGAIEDARAQCGLSPDRRRALFVGRLVPEKRLDLLLAAFSEVAAPLREWDLVIAGEGPLRAVLERSVPPLIRHRVKWLGFIEHGHLPPVYRACHLVVLPSDHEPWGVVVNEALASGLPVIASDVVGAAFELVRTGENGWIFPAGQTSALTRALAVTCGASAQFTTGAREGAALAAWRVRADPIAGLRRALTAVGAL